MIKLADTGSGTVTTEVLKRLVETDRARLQEAVGLCRDILHRLGKKDADIFLGTLNAGHPGGTLPLTEAESVTMHHKLLPHNLYVADASLLPESLGNPPILTIIAMAKRISARCLDHAS